MRKSKLKSIEKKVCPIRPRMCAIFLKGGKSEEEKKRILEEAKKKRHPDQIVVLL